MKNNEISTEDRILKGAYKIFLLFGYHGTTLQQIAMQAGVNKSAVHYYFRSKERLYAKVVKKVLDLYFDTKVEINTPAVTVCAHYLHVHWQHVLLLPLQQI